MRAVLIFIVFLANSTLFGQFHDSFTIHYVKKTNLHKSLGNESWTEQIKKVIPKYVNDKFILTYKNGTSIYKGIVEEENEKSTQVPEWVHSSVAGIEILQTEDSFKMRKDIMEIKVQIKDTIWKLNWKINATERRNIAGFDCRKAVATFNDSIIIYAFYAEELVGSTGPELIQGLPGAILGLGIPKYNATWFAEKVEFNAKQFQPTLVPKKKEKLYSLKSFKDEMKSIWGGRWDKRAEAMYWKILF
jgi:GLPGLI family protein